ncbi:MAG: phospho-sugar mutase [Propionibacteriaceae bacterium]|jgi:phosphomannomutase|nr:phospho-sugar mutase [Propionibacteriaceae bacterium]
MTELLRQVAAWIDADPDEASRDELTVLLAQAQDDEEAAEELADRFAGTLQFGTAGLRGAMAAGPNRMNRAVVMAAAKGLIDYLNSRVERPRVVIGNDARHHSREFALDTAAIVTAAGGEALLLPDQVPTPVLAYSVRHLHADAGVMVTASHNPAADNGYKVYLGGRMVTDPEAGCQIVPPYDGEIAACIAAVPPANQIAQAEGWTDLGPDVVESYIGAICAPAGAVPTGPLPPIRIVHTAMHGVGSAIALEALSRAGFSTVVPVIAQQNPNPDFPTVAFPNPEEPGAIDLALALAAQLSADVVIANDPDADRCAVAVKDPRKGWRMLHGDELGALLGEENARRTHSGVFANSIVSSRQLSVIAAHYSVQHVNTLTGFKWMGRVPGLTYAYEEAIGYCVRPDLVHDKDGLSCAVVVARLVAHLKSEGKTLLDLLDDLARRDGLYLSSQLAARFEDLSQIGQTMARLRETPLESLAGSPVTTLADLSQGYEGLPPTDGILLLTSDDDRVVVRPSGTEPKVKCYLEVILPVDPQASFDDLTALRRTAEQRLTSIKEDLNAALFS